MPARAVVEQAGGVVARGTAAGVDAPSQEPLNTGPCTVSASRQEVLALAPQSGAKRVRRAAGMR